ncbi:nicotinate-nicotinamide nucleotide adenylyltransferase [Vibrio sp. TRT 21S02]|uniref:nicotinate-nicotinamide nucleotide adenylyltransferase n=1 Tax=Vibrio sp. TRT 21S02 TaxID=3418507 RepID=UPI003CE70519
MLKIAVFGSAFNPPSLGHKSVIESLSHFDQIQLIPSISHAWGKEMLDYDRRCELVDAFIVDLSMPQVVRSTVEEELFIPGQSVTTYAVLERLQKNFPDADITFVLGPDNFFSFSKFYKAEEITKRWNVLACPERVAIRSTDIRLALHNGEDISHLTTLNVQRILVDSKYY